MNKKTIKVLLLIWLLLIPYITNIFCSGGASSYKTEAFFVSLPFRKVVSISGKYLSDALKMCADYLDIQIIRLLSLSLMATRVNIQNIP